MSDVLEELRAALAEQYEIEGELGEGGMAYVFRARDLKHDRAVAVKILKPELAANLGAERFLREIQITAKLSHPHILPLYDSGIADGYLFYVMPLVEGEPLGDLLEREKQLSIEDALKYTREAAEALAYAHSHGLVHRDIKPDNIFLSRGHAIVADFGIARALTEAGTAQLTQTGMAVGTPAYMSPEQAAGETELDGRTDIYSLGCVLYELLVGEIPFTGPNAMAIMARHSMDMITAPHIMRQSIPDDVEDVIYTCMAKTPADRFRTAQDLVEAIEGVERGAPGARPSQRISRLSQQRMSQARMSQHYQVSDDAAAPARGWRRAVVPAAAAVIVVGTAFGAWRLVGGAGNGALPGMLDPERIAVLYFEDQSADGSAGYLADAMTEGLIDELEAVRTLDVVSRNGVRPYRGSTLPPDSIARALEAGTLIGGAVASAADGYRVMVRVIDGESGVDVDRQAVSASGQGGLALRDSLVGEVARRLRRRLGDEVEVRSRRAETRSESAWTLVQRAERLRKDGLELLRHGQEQDGRSAVARADSLLAAAESEDDAWAEPAALRARIAYEVARVDPANTGANVVSAMRHATRALSLDANHAEALEVRGTAQYFAALVGLADSEGERETLIDDGRADLEAAVRADPSRASAYNTLSHLKMFRGDKQGAVLDAQVAYREDAYLDVADAVIHRLFQGYYDLEQLGDARRWCGEGRRRFPEDSRFAQCRLLLMASPGGTPSVPDAWNIAGELVHLAAPADTAFERARGRILVAGVLGRAGLVDSARAVLDGINAGPAVDPRSDLAFFEAYVRTVLGDHDRAIALLRAYLLANPIEYHSVSAGDLYWWWRPLQSHPDFARLTPGG